MHVEQSRLGNADYTVHGSLIQGRRAHVNAMGVPLGIGEGNGAGARLSHENSIGEGEANLCAAMGSVKMETGLPCLTCCTSPLIDSNSTCSAIYRGSRGSGY